MIFRPWFSSFFLTFTIMWFVWVIYCDAYNLKTQNLNIFFEKQQQHEYNICNLNLTCNLIGKITAILVCVHRIVSVHAKGGSVSCMNRHACTGTIYILLPTKCWYLLFNLQQALSNLDIIGCISKKPIIFQEKIAIIKCW